MIGLAGTGDLVATALAPESRNRRAGDLLAQGVPAAEIPARVGQAVEALETVPLLAQAMTSAALDPPVTTALARLIQGELPLDDWVAVVRTTVPPPARRRASGRPRFWRRVREGIKRLFTRSEPTDHEIFTRGQSPESILSGVSERKESDGASDHRESGSD